MRNVTYFVKKIFFKSICGVEIVRYILVMLSHQQIKIRFSVFDTVLTIFMNYSINWTLATF